MKKTLLVGSLMAAMAVSSFGQGFFNFSGGKSSAWDGFTSGTAQRDTSVDVAFLWAPTSVTTSALEQLANGTPSSGTTATSTYTQSAAWAAITTDLGAGWSYGYDNSTANSFASVATLSTGAFQFVGQPSGPANNFGVSGGSGGTPLSSSGVTYNIIVVGWNGANGLGVQSSGAIGWSQEFQYQFQTSVGTVNTPVFPAFGVAGTPTAVPEPCTMALASLGGLSLLAFRRRNKKA
jgi:hypothetical protein